MIDRVVQVLKRVPPAAVASARYLWGIDWRIRLGAAATVAVVAFFVWFALSAVSAANTARVEVADLMSQSTGLSASSLLEPGIYAQLAAQSEVTADALEDVRSKLGVFRPFEFIPILGSRVRAARNTVEIGTDFATAARIILTAYGEALAERSEGAGVESFLASQRELLAEARAALERAESLADEETVLSANEQRCLSLGISALQSLTTIALEVPGVVDEGFALLTSANELRALADDPLMAIGQTESIRTQLEALRASTHSMSARLALLDSTDDSTRLLSDVLIALDTVSAASEDVLSVAEAVELGPLSEAFGRVAGAKLTSASEGFKAADLLFADLLERSAPVVGESGSESESGCVDTVFSLVQDALAEAIEMVEIVRRGLGYEGERTYLVIMQNQNEIRATGGFIGATLELPISNGVLGDLRYVDSSLVDIPPLINNPAAPEPIFWYLWIGRLLFRDANWNPDFPHSAETLIDMYEHGRSVALDGAVSATKLLAFDLVDIVGGVEVAGVDERITSELAYVYSEGLLPYVCQEHHVSFKGRHCFDEDLVASLVEDLRRGLGESGRARLVDVVTSHLQSKNVLVYLHDEKAQEIIVSHGWAGQVGAPSQDMLMVLDSSLPGHTTATVTRQWNYHVDLVPAGVSQADLRIRYENTRSEPSPDCRQAAEGGGGCYWNYVRVLLPSTASNVRSPQVPLHEGAEKLIWGYRDLDSARTITHAGAGLANLIEVGGFVVVERWLRKTGQWG